MGANVESKIIVNIKALVDGTSKVQALSDATVGLEKTTGATASEMQKMSVVGDKLDGKFGKLTTSTKGFAFSIDGLGKKISGEFAPLEAAGRKIEEFVRKERAAIAELERVKAQRAAVASREQFFAEGRDPFAQGVEKFGETPLNKTGQTVAAASLGTNAQQNIAAMESQRAALRKMNDEAIRSGNEGSANVNKLINSFNQVDKVRRFENLLKDGSLVRTGLLKNVDASKLLQRALSPLAPIGRLVAGVFASIVRQIQFMVAAFALLAVSSPAIFFGLAVKEGLEFNSVMEQQKIGLAALIQSTHDLFNKKNPNQPLEGLEAYSAASVIAEAATNRLRVKIIPLKATSEELLPIFNQIVTAGAAAGLTLTQLEDTFVSLSSAAQILNIPTDRLGTEIRLLLSGVTRETSRLGPALFGTAAAAREFVKQHKAAGDLFPALQTKLVAYNAALTSSESSYATLKENTTEVFQLLAGFATSGLFDKIKAGLTKITTGFFDLHAGKLKPEFEALFNFLNDAGSKFGDFIVAKVQQILDFITQIADYVAKNGDYVSAIIGDVISIAQQVGGLLVDILSIVGELVAARGETVTLHNVLGFIAITIGIIRDGFNDVIGVLQVVGGVLVNAILYPMQKIVELIGIFSSSAAEAAKNMQGIRSGALNFASSGADRFARGFDMKASSDATDAFLNGGPRISNLPKTKTGATDDITSKLKRTTPSAGKGNSAADRLANRLGELKKHTADLLRQLYDSQIEIARAGEDKLFEIYKDSTSKALTSLDVDLKHRLVAFTDYYTAKNKLEQDQIEAEKKHLQDQFAFDSSIVQNKIDAINEKFNAAKIEPKNKNPKLQAELEQQRTIEIQEQKNGLKVKEIKLDEQIQLLTSKQGETQRVNNQATSDALEEIGQKNTTIQADLLEQQGRETDAEIRRVAQQYRDTLRETLANSEPASDALRSVIEDIGALGSVTTSELNGILEQAGLKFEDLSQETKSLIALMTQLENKSRFKGLDTQAGLATGNLNVKKDAIQDKINLGVISEAKGRHLIALEEQATRVELERIIALMEKLPGLTDQQKLAIAGMKQETSTLGREFDTVGNSINGVIAGDLGNFFDTLLSGTDDIKQAFASFLSGMLIGIAKVIFQAIVLKAILSALGLSGIGTAGPGSASGPGGWLSGLAGGGAFAEGGAIEGPGTGTSDSIFARVSNGEWIIPATRVAQYGRGMMSALTNGTFGRAFKGFAAGGPVGQSRDAMSGFTGLRNVNILDTDLISDHLASASGERVLLNFISKNPNKIKAKLGL
jgi:hypothetical protein